MSKSQKKTHIFVHENPNQHFYYFFFSAPEKDLFIERIKTQPAKCFFFSYLPQSANSFLILKLTGFSSPWRCFTHFFKTKKKKRKSKKRKKIALEDHFTRTGVQQASMSHPGGVCVCTYVRERSQNIKDRSPAKISDFLAVNNSPRGDLTSRFGG